MAPPAKRRRLSSGSSDSSDSADERAALLRAYEAQQRAFLAQAAPELLTNTPASTSDQNTKASSGKPVWEMNDDDFDDDDDDDDDDSDGGSTENDDHPERGKVEKLQAQTVVFQDPSRGASSSVGPTSLKDVKDFMSNKVKDTQKRKSIADQANEKLSVKKMKQKKRKELETEDGQEDAEQEAHLASLDSSLSKLIKPLTESGGRNASPLPTLLKSLPLEPEKPKKGLTPLPANAPRKMRRGQTAVNLERAKKRDAESGLLPGQGGREAQSLREKRKELGLDKRERGMGSSFGKMKGAQLKLSAKDIRQATFDPFERRTSGKKKKKGKR